MESLLMNKKVFYVYKYYFKGIKKALLKTISATLGYIHTGKLPNPYIFNHTDNCDYFSGVKRKW